MNKILVIENQVKTLNLLLKLLHHRGFEVIGAENGLLGVKLAKKNLPDLIILNTQIPELNSHSILTVIRQNPTTEITPFIFITTEKIDNQLFGHNKLVSNSYDIYLSNPLQEEELLLTINHQLQKQTILQQWSISRKLFPENQTSNKINKFAESIFPVCNCPLLNKVFQFIEENYHQQINLGDVAEAVGYSTTYLTNLVKRQTKKGIYGWIIERRMAEACSLLIKTDQSVSWIAAKVGYPDSGHFSRLFRQNYSISPKAWREKHCEEIVIKQNLKQISNQLINC